MSDEPFRKVLHHATTKATGYKLSELLGEQTAKWTEQSSLAQLLFVSACRRSDCSFKVVRPVWP